MGLCPWVIGRVGEFAWRRTEWVQTGVLGGVGNAVTRELPATA